MGSLIPSELWSWPRHWPLVVKAVVVAVAMFAAIVIMALVF